MCHLDNLYFLCRQGSVELLHESQGAFHVVMLEYVRREVDGELWRAGVNHFFLAQWRSEPFTSWKVFHNMACRFDHQLELGLGNKQARRRVFQCKELGGPRAKPPEKFFEP